MYAYSHIYPSKFTIGITINYRNYKRTKNVLDFFKTISYIIKVINMEVINERFITTD